MAFEVIDTLFSTVLVFLFGDCKLNRGKNEGRYMLCSKELTSGYILEGSLNHLLMRGQDIFYRVLVFER